MTKKEILITQKTNGRCFYCNSRNAEHVDHFVSRYWWKEWGLDSANQSEKSVDDIENLFLACKKCNCSKGHSFPEDFVGNGYRAWTRYYRANKRIGIELGFRENYYLV